MLRLAQLRGQTACTNEATLLTLLVGWVLQQSEAQYARHVLTQAQQQWVCSQAASTALTDQPVQSPSAVSSWTVTALTVQTLRLLVQGCWTFARLRSCLPYLHRFLSSRRRQRGHQESTIRRQLLVHLGQADLDSALVFSCSSA